MISQADITQLRTSKNISIHSLELFILLLSHIEADYMCKSNGLLQNFSANINSNQKHKYTTTDKE